jgi:hypothetical protein
VLDVDAGAEHLAAEALDVPARNPRRSGSGGDLAEFELAG